MSRVEEYRRPDGTWSRSRHDAILVPAVRVARLAQQYGGDVPVCYFVGTAQHESNFASNERDTEENGYESWGLYQLSLEERVSVGLPQADLLDPEQATEVMARLAARYRRHIRSAANLVGADPPDVCAYIAIAHNQGLHAALRSIERYGLDWVRYKARNPTVRIVSSGYGDDVRPHA